MEKSYLCAEQVYQMQAVYDGMVMVKIAHDAGCDVKTNPITYYVYEFGYQGSVFENCLKLMFEELTMHEGENEEGMPVTTYRLVFPELLEFFRLISPSEKDHIVNRLNALMGHSDDYFCEFEMEGFIAENCIHFTLTESYGIYSEKLQCLAAVRNEVLMEIQKRKMRLIQNLKNLVLLKTVYDRFGVKIEVPLDEQEHVICHLINEQLKLDLEADAALTYDTMSQLLSTFIDHRANQIDKGEEAA
ncbi:hypothetical protein [Paenibacillus sp. MMO-177]|uniref:hypothetical protein n=1 Tax=Paenibacillus sp. MMO-177 TaxID=3081289 RepID=UPI0030186537